jgi:rubredoxin
MNWFRIAPGNQQAGNTDPAKNRIQNGKGGFMAQYRCPECGYTFDEEKGDMREGYPPGPFEDLPDDFTCPDCSVRYKEDFERVE